jgi:hypothetical protein
MVAVKGGLPMAHRKPRQILSSGQGLLLTRSLLLASFVLVSQLVPARPQIPLGQLNESGHVVFDGHSTPYLIRHLPVSSFPDLPLSIQEQLNQRGCLIPQTYAAHGPENVVHGSLERPGSSDWAVLCSAQGTVSLLVFFTSEAAPPTVLATALETARLQTHDPTGVLGFNWGIDSATPEQVHEAQSNINPRPPRLDHDALADSVVDYQTVYHYFTRNAWTVVDVDIEN